MCRSPLQLSVSDMPPCLASAVNICALARVEQRYDFAGSRPPLGVLGVERSPAQLTWSKNPMPVLTSMTCLVTPGVWSRSIVHVIWVSPVTRSTVAVLEVLMVVVSCEAAIKSRASIKESANRGRDIWVGQRRCGQSPTRPLALLGPLSFTMPTPVRDFTLATTIMADTKQVAAIQAKLQQSSVAFQKIECGAWVTRVGRELTSQRWRGSSRRDRD